MSLNFSFDIFNLYKVGKAGDKSSVMQRIHKIARCACCTAKGALFPQWCVKWLLQWEKRQLRWRKVYFLYFPKNFLYKSTKKGRDKQTKRLTSVGEKDKLFFGFRKNFAPMKKLAQKIGSNRLKQVFDIVHFSQNKLF